MNKHGDKMPTKKSKKKVQTEDKKEVKKNLFKDALYLVYDNAVDDGSVYVNVLCPLTTNVEIVRDTILYNIDNRIKDIFREMVDNYEGDISEEMQTFLETLLETRIKFQDYMPENVYNNMDKWDTEIFKKIYDKYWQSFPGYESLSSEDYDYLDDIKINVSRNHSRPYKYSTMFTMNDLTGLTVKVTADFMDGDDPLYDYYACFRLIPMINKIDNKYFLTSHVEFPQMQKTISVHDSNDLATDIDLGHIEI